MSDYKAIKKIINAIDRAKVNKDRQCRFKALVDVHGVELVAMASGLAPATVKVYVSARKNIQTIGLEPLTQAEYVFKELEK